MKFLSLFAFVILTSSCCSQKITNTIGPFEGDYQPYAQSWTGGIPGSGSGVNLFLTLFDADPASIEAVYYKGMSTTVIDTVSTPQKFVIARFQTDFNKNPDRIMNLDSQKEYGNEPPKKKEKFPFELEDNEAVVKFARNGKYIYTKIKGIKMKSSMDLPSRPQ